MTLDAVESWLKNALSALENKLVYAIDIIRNSVFSALAERWIN